MRFISFNVNSIRAYLGKKLTKQWQKYHPDVFSMEELKLTEKEHKDFPLVMDGYDNLLDGFQSQERLCRHSRHDQDRNR